MSRLALFLAGALIPGPMLAYEIEGNSIILTDAEVRQCVEQGGCRLITKAWLAGLVQAVKDQGCRGSI